MRYIESENPYIIARFTTGDTVTVDIYDLSDSSLLINGAAMTEVGTTGYFKYQFNPSPTSLKEYLYVADNSTEEHAGKIILGGYPDNTTDIAIESLSENARNQVNAECDTAVSDYGANTIIPPTSIEIRQEIDSNSTRLDADMSSRAISGEYDIEMGYIPSDLGDVPTAIEGIRLSGQGKLDVKAECDASVNDLNDITVAQIISGIADGSYDLQEMMRLVFAACCNKSSGGGTSTLIFRNSDDNKNRITETVDSDGNRLSVTLDGS